jgi:hypothetical protein
VKCPGNNSHLCIFLYILAVISHYDRNDPNDFQKVVTYPHSTHSIYSFLFGQPVPIRGFDCRGRSDVVQAIRAVDCHCVYARIIASEVTECMEATETRIKRWGGNGDYYKRRFGGTEPTEGFEDKEAREVFLLKASSAPFSSIPP